MATLDEVPTSADEFGRVDLRLTHAAALLWCEAMSVPFDPAHPHPSLAYQVAMEAVPYPALWARLGITEQDRAVAGEVSIEIRTAVQIDHDYTVRSTIDPIEHKHGATAGAFEKATIRAAAFRPGSDDPDFGVVVSILITRGRAA